ncbi:helix-turn-helix domain-containing protein [Micromonospora carbonacea]|uniref:Helix-turn-helix domain-containing protein n=1 Tax=Micromonospora carbonacea TaxID=47853 RepID=A0A7H8XKV0_9ACTN|nr:helix-turn-helix domain-containing protein [Micromonospora carbonacea]MBB5828144.1 excisionase family DNA binding protein [Micromonospora carbonacea]QLD24211.1 helix-turn-helix domain-containing protein [Micromonospora carbonacea]
MTTVPPRVVAIDSVGRPVTLDEQGMAHLRRALRAHLDWCHRSGITPPPDLVAMATTVAGNGRSGRESVREVDQGPPPGHRHVVMSYREAAQYLGVSTRTLRRHRAAGLLRATGRRLVIPVPLDRAELGG